MSWVFLRHFFTNWQATGAIAPSSRRLARQVVELAGVAEAGSILELGPGTGPFTQVIDEVMPRDSRYLGLELNPVFAERLRAKHPHMGFVTTAAQDYDPGGRLVTFAYLGFHLLPKGRHLRELLESRLGRVECGQTVWRNLPPAFVYAGTKPA